MAAKRLDIAGQRFGALVAIEPSGSARGAIIWWCECDCGSGRHTVAGELNSGQITHCGCRCNGNINKRMPRKTRPAFVECPTPVTALDVYLRGYRPKEE